jgi:predicted ATP-binding protein involved in virulence
LEVTRGGIATREPAASTTVTARADIQSHDITWSTRTTTTGREVDKADLRSVAKTLTAKLHGADPVELPVIAYFGTARLFQTGARELILGTSVLDGYAQCLEPTANHELLKSWMSWRESVRLQGISRAVETGAAIESVHEPLLEAVSSAIQNCIEGTRRFYYSMHHQDLRLELVDGRIIPFNLLSDGYRNLVSLIADIAWRAARLNPHHGTGAAKNSTGVVLIDELDLHLHPAWQRRVIGDLRRTFPNIQFVATTHSPQVVSTAKPEWIRVLTADQQVGTALHTYGRDSNSLLNEVFGTSERPIETERKIEEVEALLSQRKLDDARATLRILERDLGPDDAIVHGLLWELNDIQVNDAKDPQES